MRFDNATPLPAALVPNAEDGDRMRILVVAAVACRIEEDGLILLEEQPPLLRDPKLPYPNDIFFLRERSVGVTVTGFVYPTKIGETHADARLTVGDRLVRVRAHGPRTWKRTPAGLAPSVPEPFERVAMTWDNAFGGSVRRPATIVKVDGEPTLVMAHDASFPLNPRGKGFSLSEDEANGRPLAPLEDPDRPVERWDDYPEPVCWAPCPLDCGLRAGFVVRDGEVVREDIERLASRAAPRTTFEAIAPGTTITVEGMRPGAEAMVFAIPESPLELEIGVGPDGERMRMALDCVDIDAEERTVRLVYRTTFGYDLVQHEQRWSILRASAVLPATPGEPLR